MQTSFASFLFKRHRVKKSFTITLFKRHQVKALQELYSINDSVLSIITDNRPFHDNSGPAFIQDICEW